QRKNILKTLKTVISSYQKAGFSFVDIDQLASYDDKDFKKDFSRTSKQNRKAEVLSLAHTASGSVALTFDGIGNGQLVHQILDALDQNNIKATFFASGYDVLGNLELAKEIVRAFLAATFSVEERHAKLELPPRSPEIQALFDAREPRGAANMLNLDPPDHHRLRRLVSKVFTPRTVEGLRPRVQALVDAHLDAVAPAGEMDLIADLAFPLPFVVISELLGIPDSPDRLRLREWSGAIVKQFDPILTDDEIRAAFEAADGFWELANELVAWKRSHPGDDLLTGLIAAEEDGDRLSADELVEQLILLYIAGHETTTNLIGNALVCLHEWPQEKARLLQRLHEARDDRERQEAILSAAVDEFLRFESSNQLGNRRALREAEIGGVRLPAGALTCTSPGRDGGTATGPVTYEDIAAVAMVVNRKPEGLLKLWPAEKKGNLKPMTAENLAAALAKRPWNHHLKVLCWKISRSFVMSKGRPGNFYGKVYEARKALETQRNEAGEYAAQAVEILRTRKIGKTTEAYKWYKNGMLPPAQIEARARRYAVKLFLAHYHEVAYRVRYGEPPPKPYPLAHLGHTEYIMPPNLHVIGL
ncbi:cytochrome P450, partial [Alicyclobacillus sp.]|uniref:cytochrome P450 n=1 Tax=Alicyclobacillus sp. TaxID=61169 RepID=UPI0025C5D0CE